MWLGDVFEEVAHDGFRLCVNPQDTHLGIAAQERRHDEVELDHHAVAGCQSLQESVALLVRERAHLLQQVRVQHLRGHVKRCSAEKWETPAYLFETLVVHGPDTPLELPEVEVGIPLGYGCARKVPAGQGVDARRLRFVQDLEKDLAGLRIPVW
ncbi:hypothetical protein OUZ56_017766 [Daphnia magna]|uniref:Uncharacterized protein n=1 Tax=Daphnia magna TaxID=35525 RepID=A0ABR0ATP7_9CRUS|nr:hypothetical protein OUZ56_017766 [Daphnia magna]